MRQVKPIAHQPFRATFALLMASALLMLADGAPAIGVEGSDSVEVTAQVELADPGCEYFPISFLPSLEYSNLNDPILIQVPDSLSDTAVISLYIIDGETEDCNPITGYVTFSETGFEDSNGDPVTFLSTDFECDGSLLADFNDTFTCGQGGASSPMKIDLTVTADGDALQDYYTNVISIDLFANP